MKHGTVLNALAQVVRTSESLDSTIQSQLTISTVAFDEDGEHSNVSIPAIEITAQNQIRVRSNNTDFVGHAHDGEGNRTGRIYRSIFRLPVEIAVYTSRVDPYNARGIAHDIERALRPYDTRVESADLVDPSDGTPIDVTDVMHQGVEPDHDMTMTPTMRRWRQSLDVVYRDCYVTESEPITTVITPTMVAGASETVNTDIDGIDDNVLVLRD